MYVGVDPDTHTTAIAVLKDDEKGHPALAGAWICRTHKKLTQTQGILHQCRTIVQLFGQGIFPVEWHDKIKAFMVECPEIAYTAADGKNPRDVMKLVWPASSTMSLAMGLFNDECLFGMPTPQEWKGSVPKAVNQRRTYDTLGISVSRMGGSEVGYQVPGIIPKFVGSESITLKTDWKHLGDAIGIALFCRKKQQLARRIIEQGQRINLADSLVLADHRDFKNG